MTTFAVAQVQQYPSRNRLMLLGVLDEGVLVVGDHLDFDGMDIEVLGIELHGAMDMLTIAVAPGLFGLIQPGSMMEKKT